MLQAWDHSAHLNASQTAQDLTDVASRPGVLLLQGYNWGGHQGRSPQMGPFKDMVQDARQSLLYGNSWVLDAGCLQLAVVGSQPQLLCICRCCRWQ